MAHTGRDYYEIQKLLHLYGVHLDKADLTAYANLFAHGKLVFVGDPDTVFDRDPQGLEEFFGATMIIYECGTPRTRHVSSNAIIDIDDSGRRATVESYMTVFQATDTLPLQAIGTGTDYDVFEKIDGVWRFSMRRAVPGLIGDMSHHTRVDFS